MDAPSPKIARTSESILSQPFHPRPVLVGEVLYDYFETKDGTIKKLGGAPFNASWSLRGLGLNPLLVSRVGKDVDGEAIISEAKSWELDTAGIQIDDNAPTGNVQVTVKEEGEPSFNITPDCAYDFISGTECLDMAKVELQPDDPNADKVQILLYHGTLASRTTEGLNAIRSITSGFQNLPWVSRVVRLVDINLRPPHDDSELVKKTLLEDSVRIVKLNEDEMHFVEEKCLPNSSNSAEASKDPASSDTKNTLDRVRNVMSHFNLDMVILTLGGRGALLVRENAYAQANASGVIIASSSPLENTSQDTKQDEGSPVDTVGAGDSVASVVITGLLRGWALDTTVARATRLASKVVRMQGSVSHDPLFYSCITKM